MTEAIPQILLAVAGLYGGLEGIKWLFTRKTGKREEKAKAKESEYKVLEHHIQFLQEQLANKEERFAEQTQLVRRLNNEILVVERTAAELRLELEAKRCNDQACPYRQPPAPYTPPPPDISRDEWHTKHPCTECAAECAEVCVAECQETAVTRE